MVTGIVGWVSDAVPDTVGIALIAVGLWVPQCCGGSFRQTPNRLCRSEITRSVRTECLTEFTVPDD